MSDVAMVYSMLYNNSNDWKKDLGWIIRILSDGMISPEDWLVLKRRQTWELLASLYQSSESDTVLRRSLLKVGSFLFFCSLISISIFYLKKVLANLTCIAQETNSLLKSSLLYESRFNCYILLLRVLCGLVKFWKIFL